MKELVIDNLHAEADGLEILKGINLKINQKDVLALLGPNGHGKSTLLNVIMGNPRYKITKGAIYLDGEDISNLEVDNRSKLGLFLAFQNPPEVEGVEVMDFYKQMLNSHRESPISLFEFYNLLTSGYKEVELPEDMNTRHLNEGFSGGEKKRNEMLQMKLLNPKLAMLDEIDSGLDVDALKLIADLVNKQKEKGTSFIVISHYARLFSLIKPNRAAIVINGKIAIDGETSLIDKVDKQGYEFLNSEYGIDIKKHEQTKVNVLASCAFKKVK